MSKAIIQNETLTDIADAVREMTGSSEEIPTTNLASSIRSIQQGFNVYDSLPVGSRIMFEGNVEDIPDGWEEVQIVDNPYIFSTTEHIVGVWTDGRPVYAKTYTINLDGSSNLKRIAHEIEDIDFAVDYKGHFVMTGASSIERRFIPQVYYGDAKYTITLYMVNDTELLLYYGDWLKERASIDYSITLYYVKETVQSGGAS